MFIEGSISVKAAMINQKRKVIKIYFKKNKITKDFNYLKYLAHHNNIPFELKDDTFFKNFNNSGGVVAEVCFRKYDTLNLAKDLIILITGIEDPYNLAYILRTAAAYNCDIILEAKDLSLMEGLILKSSAGAFDSLNIYQSVDLLSDLNQLKKHNFKINALYRGLNAKPLIDMSINTKNVLIIGGEKRGINKQILKICDEYLFIPYFSEFKNALNASSAMAIATAWLRYKL